LRSLLIVATPYSPSLFTLSRHSLSSLSKMTISCKRDLQKRLYSAKETYNFQVKRIVSPVTVSRHLSPELLSLFTLSPHCLSRHFLSSLSTLIVSLDILSPHCLSPHSFSSLSLVTLSPQCLSSHSLSSLFNSLSLSSLSLQSLFPAICLSNCSL